MQRVLKVNVKKCGLRVSDPDAHPDPHESVLIWVAWSGSAFKLRMRIRIQIADPDKDLGGEKWNKIFLKKPEFSCFEVLDVIYGGLGISKLQFMIVRSLSVSLFIEKEPRKQLRM